MASNRHLGRIIVLQSLFECEFRQDCGDDKCSIEDIVKRNFERYHDLIEDKKFTIDLAKGVSQKSDELDSKLQPIAPEWPIDQIARIDRNILRIGLYELLYEKDVPPKVVINESVELAKSFGNINSSKFINGVLGTALSQSEVKTKTKKTK